MDHCGQSPLPDHHPASFRVRLLGDFERFTPDGRLIEHEALAGGIQPALLVRLALQPGSVISARELYRSAYGYPATHSADLEKLQAPISRLRGSQKRYEKGQLPIAHAGTIAADTLTYILNLARVDVDATLIIDWVQGRGGRGGLEFADPSDLSFLMGLWRGNPLPPPPDAPSFDPWRDLRAALARFRARLEQLPQTDSAKLSDLARFQGLFELPAPRDALPKVLIVEDDTTFVRTFLEPQLHGFEVVHVAAYDDFLPAIERHQGDFKAALIDRHLLGPESLDELGEQVLTTLSKEYPSIPRALITSDHPDGDDQTLYERYGLFRVITKGETGSSVRELRSLIQQMVTDRRRQLEATLAQRLDSAHRAINAASRSSRRTAATKLRPAISSLYDQVREDLDDAASALRGTSVDMDDEAFADAIDGLSTNADELLTRVTERAQTLSADHA